MSCKSDNNKANEFDPIAVSINDIAMQKYQDYILGYREDEEVLDTVLFELNRAIDIDSSNYVFYTNKATVLSLLNQDNNARKAFSAVTKVASKVNRGAKVSAKGVTGTIARAVRKIL